MMIQNQRLRPGNRSYYMPQYQMLCFRPVNQSHDDMAKVLNAYITDYEITSVPLEVPFLNDNCNNQRLPMHPIFRGVDHHIFKQRLFGNSELYNTYFVKGSLIYETSCQNYS
jgi:hypothetical protein